MEARAPSSQPVDSRSRKEISLRGRGARASTVKWAHSTELENIPAQILIFNNVSQRFADVLGVNRDLLAFSFRCRKADFIEHAFHDRVKATCSDIFCAFVHAKCE